MSSAGVSLPGAASSVPAARRFAESIIASWGHPDVAWTAAQVVSELATNVAIHARTAFHVNISADAERVRIEVVDTSPASVQPRAYSSTATTGRGLRMVAALADSWGVDRNGPAKTVWAHLSLSIGARDAGDDTEADVDALLLSFGDVDAGGGRSVRDHARGQLRPQAA